ncbi:MAG TPA: O-antigen ligase family protein, partial [Acidimicrobiales bacterium]
MATILPLASTTALDQPSWALRWALLPAIAGCGVPALIALATGAGPHRRAARWALAWLAWAAISTALAPRPWLSFWGEYQIGTGWVFLAALAASWAIGARAGRPAGRLVAQALLAGCALQAAVAVAEQVVSLAPFGVSTFEGRSAGLYGNPVYLGELLCGGLWLALWWLREADADRPRAVAAGIGSVVVITAGLDLSGSRAALALGIAAGALVTVRARGIRRLVVAASLVAGIAVAGLAALGARGTSTTATSRAPTVAVAADGYGPRLATWRGGLVALGTRPLWGWGPGDFLAAAGPERNLTVARDNGPDTMF